MERPGRWRTFGLTYSMVCESRSSATMGGGLSQLSSSRRARSCRRTRRFAADEAWHVSDETFRHAGETIFQSQRSPPETNPGYQWASVKQRGSIMWAFIINSIYREILRTSLSGMRKFAADR